METKILKNQFISFAVYSKGMRVMKLETKELFAEEVFLKGNIATFEVDGVKYRKNITGKTFNMCSESEKYARAV